MLFLLKLLVAVVEESNVAGAGATVERKHARYGYGWRGRWADPCSCPAMSKGGTDIMAAPTIPTRAPRPSLGSQWPT